MRLPSYTGQFKRDAKMAKNRAAPCSAAAAESTIDRPATPPITPRMSSVLGLKARP